MSPQPRLASSPGHAQTLGTRKLHPSPAIPQPARRRQAKHWELLLNLGDTALTASELACGLDPNVSMSDGITPIMRCARDGDHEMLLTIAQASTKPLDLDAQAKFGSTAAGLASKNDHIAALDLLISFGATLDPPDYLPLNPLMIAATNGSSKCLARLIDRGVDVNRRARDGMSALSLSCMSTRLRCSLLLIQAGADVNAPTHRGQTPLMLACDEGSRPIIRALLRAGADTETRDCAGMRVLMRAARSGRVPTLDLLLAAGAQLQAKDAFGRDAHAHAILSGADEAAAHLFFHKAALAECAAISDFCRPGEAAAPAGAHKANGVTRL